MPKLDDDLNALFTLPLTEFIGARKLLVTRLKKDGRSADAEYVQSLTKPSISAWTVNQVYWQHRDAFDRLLTTGQRFHKAQTSGKMANMREALDARRDALSDLSNLATTLLRDAGHNASIETIRRITTTLEALSVYASHSDGPTPGRLTQDVDPPGFESFAGFKPSKSVVSAQQSAVGTKTQSSKHKVQSTKTESSHRAEVTAAKISLQNAKKALAASRAAVQRLEAAKKQTDALAKEVEKQRRDAEQRFKRANAAAEDVAERAHTAAAELREATEKFDAAKRAVETSTKELESLFREKP